MKKYQKYTFVGVTDCKELGNEPKIMCVNHLLFICSHFHFYYTENMRLLYHGNKGIISQVSIPKQHDMLSCQSDCYWMIDMITSVLEMVACSWKWHCILECRCSLRYRNKELKSVKFKAHS